MVDKVNNSLTAKKFNVLKIENIAVALMCIYAMLVYANYVSPSLAAVQSLALYAFVGMGAVMAVLRGKLRLNQYSVWYMVYLSLSFVCALFSAEQSFSISHAYRLLVVFLITLAMVSIVRTRRHLELLMASMVVGATILAVYMYSSGMFDTAEEVGGRLGGTLTGNANNLAAIYMFAVCAAIYFIISAKKLPVKLVFLACAALQVYVLMLSGGRKTFIIPFAVLYIILLMKKDRKGKRHVILYTVIMAAAVLLIYYLLVNVPAFYETVGYRIKSFVDYMLGDTTAADGSIIERGLMRKRALDLWFEKPIFGHGLNMFTALGGFNVYSHCNYTEMLCNQGLVGFALYYSFMVYVLIALLKKRSNDIMKPFFVAVIFGLFLFDYGAITYLSPVVHMFIMMACMFNNDNSEMITDIQGDDNP